MPPSRTAIALAPSDISTSSCVLRGRLDGSGISTTLTAAAVLSRSSSQRSRKLAIEGMKISTSAISTNRIVSSKSLVDSPRDSGTFRWSGTRGAASAPGCVMGSIPFANRRRPVAPLSRSG